MQCPQCGSELRLHCLTWFACGSTLHRGVVSQSQSCKDHELKLTIKRLIEAAQSKEQK